MLIKNLFGHRGVCGQVSAGGVRRGTRVQKKSGIRELADAGDPLSLGLGLGLGLGFLKCVQHADTEPVFHQLAQGEPVASSSSLNGRRPEYVRCLLKKLPVSSSLKTLEMRSSRITDELAVRP